MEFQSKWKKDKHSGQWKKKKKNKGRAERSVFRVEDAWASNVVGDCFLRAGEKYVLVAHTSCRGYTMCVRRVRREFYASLSPTYASILLNRIIYARICIWNVTAEPKSAERPTNQARLRRLSPLIRVSFSPRVLFSSPTRSFIKRRDLTLRGISRRLFVAAGRNIGKRRRWDRTIFNACRRAVLRC